MQTGDSSKFNNEIDLVETTDPGHADTFNPLFKILIDNDAFLYATKADLKEMLDWLSTKVDKVAGKQLSTNDYTTAEKNKLAGVQANANNYVHPATHPASMIVEDATRQFVSATEKLKLVNDVYTKNETDLRIQAVIDNAPDALDTLKEISEALNNDPNFANTVINQLTTKVDKVADKQLSTNDYTTAEKNKLAGVQANANNYVHPATHSASMIVEDATRQFVSVDDKTNWNNKLAATANAVSASKLLTGRTIALSGDVTGSAVFDGSSNITITATVADDSHAHVIANIDGLQAALDAKLAATANAVSASKLLTGRTIALSGDVTGSAVFDGSSNITITATVADDSHAHVIANIDGLQAALDAKETPNGAQAKANQAEANAKSYATNMVSIGSSANPNTTQEAYILTNHANSPGGGIYWHILTFFYSTKTGNRAQIAVSYNGSTPRLEIRHMYGSTWTTWQALESIVDAQAKATQAETNAKTYADEKFATKSEISNAGFGDMLKSVYDKNGDGIVDAAASVPWTGVTGKPSTFPPSTHNHQSITFTDSRAVNFSPFSFTGLSLHIKQNAADGLSDGGTYHGVLHMAQWNDASGGRPHQLAFTDNGNIFFRQHNGTDWTAWKKLSFDGHAHTIANVTGLQAVLDAKETPSGAQAKATAVQTNLNTHTADTVKHITSAERTAWNAKALSASGTFTGNATANRAISLGFRPKYVKVIGNDQMFELYPSLSQITPRAKQLDGNNFILNDSVHIGAITATGFTLGSSTASKANASGKTYTYIAFS